MNKSLFALAFLTTLSVTQCQINSSKNESVNANAVNNTTQTTAPSLLYFKNIRSASYQSIDNNDNEAELYRLKELSISDNRPTFCPLIANYWLEDRAHLKFRMIYPDGTYTENFTVHWTTGIDSGNFDITAENQMAAALKILEISKQEGKFFFSNDGSARLEILDTSRERKLLKIIFNDYLRLTENL